jgi:hypothetical protein
MLRIFSILFLSICLFESAQVLVRPLIVGHRGTAYLPELTLASQSMAHAYGADIIEIDVCLSRDNQLIVIHGKSFIYWKFINLIIVFFFI